MRLCVSCGCVSCSLGPQIAAMSNKSTKHTHNAGTSLLPPPPHCLKSTPHVGSTLPLHLPLPLPCCAIRQHLSNRYHNSIKIYILLFNNLLLLFVNFSLPLSLVDLFSVSLSFFQLDVEKFPEKRFCGKPRNDRRIQPAMFDDNLRGICSVGARDGDEDADGDGAG